MAPPYGPEQIETQLFLESLIQDLKDTLDQYRASHGKAMAIAAPQIGVRKRLVYLEPKPGASDVLINPEVTPLGQEIIETWENCMSFPERLVRVRRHKNCSIVYLDPEWRRLTARLSGGLSVIVQHECDHLDGILATDKALDIRTKAMPMARVKARARAKPKADANTRPSSLRTRS